MYKTMKKVLAAILLATLGVTSVMADDIFDDENLHPFEAVRM